MVGRLDCFVVRLSGVEAVWDVGWTRKVGIWV